MAHDDDGLTSAALLLGGGLAGYAIGHWLDRRHDDEPLAEPAPVVAPPLDEPVSSPSQVPERNGRSGAKRYTREGRTILRDGVAAIEIVRVDLGDQRYAISPHETDLLTKQIVRLLNGGR